MVNELPSIKDFNDAFDNKSPMIGSLNEQTAIQLIASLTGRHLYSLFGQVDNLPSEQTLAMFGEMLLEEYPHLKTSEIPFVFKEAAKGRYGETYGKVDVSTLFKWFNGHYRASREHFAIIREQEHEKRKKTSQIEANRSSDRSIIAKRIGFTDEYQKKVKEFHEKINNLKDKNLIQ